MLMGQCGEFLLGLFLVYSSRRSRRETILALVCVKDMDSCTPKLYCELQLGVSNLLLPEPYEDSL